MSQIIDRRPNSRHKSAVNRSRFLRRFKKQIQKSVNDAVAKRSITDFEHGEKINIPHKDIGEPTFKHGEGGTRSIVLSGNKDFSRGDKIKLPDKDAEAAGGSEASDQGEGADNFAFEISREEFLNIFFDDLELPNLLKKQLAQSKSYSMVRAGFTTTGVPTNINIVRSFRSALARRISLINPAKKRLQQAETELEELNKKNNNDASKLELETKIAKLKHKISKVPFIDPFDLKYNRRIAQPALSSKAVVFCLMDVSGSMDEAKKDVAKRFFILLYLFLTRTYETIDIVFIRHHTSAKEVNEQDFFYSRETGGTVVSSALEMMNEIIYSRYPASEWNIYGAQASDGDNWNNDSPHCKDLLMHNIMPHVQYFAYIEIMPRHHQNLWEEYLQVKATFPNFAMQNIASAADIYPVFRELFKRQQINTKV